MSEEIKQQLDRIEQYSLLAAKNVLCFDDVAFICTNLPYGIEQEPYSHQIPHYKPNGKQLYFDRKEIEDWMKQNRVASGEVIPDGS